MAGQDVSKLVKRFHLNDNVCHFKSSLSFFGMNFSFNKDARQLL